MHAHYIKRKKYTKQRSFIDKLVVLGIIATPVVTLPQVYLVWFEGNKEKLVNYLAFMCGYSFIWLLYGLKHREKPIIITQALCVITYSLVVIGLVT